MVKTDLSAKFQRCIIIGTVSSCNKRVYIVKFPFKKRLRFKQAIEWMKTSAILYCDKIF